MRILPKIACITGFTFVAGGVYAQKRPNVVIINIDDLGWTDLSFNGSSYYETPNIDKLKRSGVYFSQAYASASNSAPSRASLMTGQYTPRHGIYTVGSPERGNAQDRKLIPYPNKLILDTAMLTFPKVLKEAGYQTCHIGKWHIGDDPRHYGFDINIAGDTGGQPASYFAPYNNPHLPDGPQGEYLPERLSNEVVNFLKNVDKNQPFFLNYATFLVHDPLQPKPDLFEKYLNKPSTDAHNNPKYAAMVEAMDNSIGQVIGALDSLGLSQNTLIIFTSDNGGVYDYSKQWPLRAGKGSFYEGGIRVPLIFVWAGTIEGGHESAQVVSQIDLFPTLLDIIGIKKPKGHVLDGISLQMFLKKSARQITRTLFWHLPAYLQGGNEQTSDPIFRSRPVSVMRSGDWKLIENFETGKLELYNVVNDISEKNDLINTELKKAKEMKALLKKMQTNTRAPIHFEINPQYVNNPEELPAEVYRHDPDLKLYFSYPNNKQATGEKLPAIVFFFGGGWTGGSVQHFARQAEYFSQKGMLAVLADYRIQNKHQTTPYDAVQDAKSAIRYLKVNADRLGVDTTRLAAGGGSAGGHLAACTAFCPGNDAPEDDLSISPVPKALVLYNPIVNTTPVQFWGDRMGENYMTISPYHHIYRGAPPTLILHGTEDEIVPPSTVEAFCKKMTETGNHCILKLYQGYGHAFFNYSETDPTPYHLTLNDVDEFLTSLGYIKSN